MQILIYLAAQQQDMENTLLGTSAIPLVQTILTWSTATLAGQF